MQETTFVLDRLRVVKIDAHIWGGRKKLRKEDLIIHLAGPPTEFKVRRASVTNLNLRRGAEDETVRWN